MIRISEAKIELASSRIEASFDVKKFAEHSGQSLEDADSYFKMSVAEAKRTLQLLDGIELSSTSKVLEIGAGLGIASSIMADLGFSVTAIEPGGIGFELNQVNSSFVSQFSAGELTVVNDSAENAEFGENTQFDLIYSNNVLEHVNSFSEVIRNSLRYLSKDGLMIHSCPNYAFPFEPHFGAPLVPFFPSMTRFFLPAAVRHSGLWKSLNFVTYKDVCRVVRGTEYAVQFRRGTMTKSFSRLRNDAEFLKRHSLLGKLASNPLLYAVMKRTLSLPKAIATPMDFVIHHKSISESQNVQSWIKKF